MGSGRGSPTCSPAAGMDSKQPHKGIHYPTFFKSLPVATSLLQRPYISTFLFSPTERNLKRIFAFTRKGET